ncbi:MAG TPA: NAD(P)H-dependent oxidoreductase [Paenibacillus sp.]|nr:NAD(P)H-dependent oxidoreductase [Paenibacillus sp.]
MNIVLISAHPNPNSLNGAIRDTIRRGFADAGHDVRDIDLYADAFDPVLVVNETRRRRDLHLDPDTARYRELLAWADRLVFVYPVWWQGPPAMLKGFFDRVLAANFAYSFKGKRKGALLPDGLFRGKRAWVVYTTDTPRWLAWIDPGYLAIKHYVLQYVGIGRIRRSMIASVKRKTRERLRRELERLYRIAASS